MLSVTTVITRAIHAMRRGIDSGRRAVQDLLSNRSAPSTLVESFVQIQEELKQFRQPDEDPNLYFICEGRTKPLRAAVELDFSTVRDSMPEGATKPGGVALVCALARLVPEIGKVRASTYFGGFGVNQGLRRTCVEWTVDKLN